MPEDPYPPEIGTLSYRLKQMETWRDRIEARMESLNMGRLEDKLDYQRRDMDAGFTRLAAELSSVKDDLSEHITDVKPLLEDMAGRRGLASGVKNWIQYGVILAILGLGAVLNVIVFARGH